MRIAAVVVSLLLVSLVAAPSFETGKAADKESEAIIRLEREWARSGPPMQLWMVSRLNSHSSLVTFGLGSDAPILLDYRQGGSSTPVIRLQWRKPEANVWARCADSFDGFADMLGLD